MFLLREMKTFIMYYYLFLIYLLLLYAAKCPLPSFNVKDFSKADFLKKCNLSVCAKFIAVCTTTFAIIYLNSLRSKTIRTRNAYTYAILTTISKYFLMIFFDLSNISPGLASTAVYSRHGVQ